MICLRCDNEDFVEVPEAEIEQELKGETLRVKSRALMCSMCGWITVDPARADELRRRTADAYRKKHGLLTSEDLRMMRKALGKSQREFAAFLRVGEASVKRWETWLVQDKSSDALIRLRCLHAPVELAAPNYITGEMSVATIPHGKIEVDLGPVEDEAQMTMFCEWREAGIECRSPPGVCDHEVVACSLSAPIVISGWTLKKDMRFAAAIWKSNS